MDIMERLDQGSLQPSTKHPDTDMSQTPSACSAGGHSNKELPRQLTHLFIMIRYMTAPVYNVEDTLTTFNGLAY
jgi:hypothetical protein